MNTVRARVWQFRLERNIQVVATVVGRGTLAVSLARLLHINAMACDLRKVLDYRTKQLEVRLLLSYLGAPGGNALQLDHRAFAASSRHIRGFVSECSGLGVLTAASEAIFAWQHGTHDLHNFDALPRQLLWEYDAKGVRPDLLFHLPTGPVAGEARGRYRRAKNILPKKPLSPQKDRLRELANWSSVHNDHSYFMSWLYIGPSGVAVDIFLPANPRWDWGTGLRAAAFQADEEQDDAQEWRFPLQDDLPRWTGRRPTRRRPVPDDEDLLHVVDEARFAASAPTLPLDLLELDSQERATRVIDSLFRTAPEAGPDAELAGIPVRGTWAPADQLGDARYEVLLGVLAAPAGDRGDVRRVDVEERLARSEGSFDVCLDGRLLTVVRPVTAPRPEWTQLERVLLADR
ncbi:hypothetical protein [Micromonospora sp. B006]|uniref:hypothetical protein n=1 Tax=Micromonospora sp. B006 TaxID=2201999 RepID=UPI000E3324FE|nr:hypothetical protein [Micromonospora sp. B006]AXO32606.1 hypothetical protein MicB006_0297 [Micromonospora sp. B006]